MEAVSQGPPWPRSLRQAGAFSVFPLSSIKFADGYLSGCSIPGSCVDVTQSISTCWHPPKAHVPLPAATGLTRPAHTHTLHTPFIYTCYHEDHASQVLATHATLISHTAHTAHSLHIAYTTHTYLMSLTNIYHTSLSIHNSDHISRIP